jgi:hypothetical protein
MATPVQGIASQGRCGTAPARVPVTDITAPCPRPEDDLIMSDIEVQGAQAVANEHPQRGVKVVMERILHRLRDGRTLGPLSVLLILLVYSLLSPLLPPSVHEYIYHILH